MTPRAVAPACAWVTVTTARMRRASRMYCYSQPATGKRPLGSVAPCGACVNLGSGRSRCTPCRHRVATVSPPDCAEIGSVRCQVWGSPRFRASARVQVGGVDFRRRRVETPVEGADAVAELPETTGATDVFDLPVLIRRNTLAGQVSPKPPGWSGQEHAHAHGRGGQVGGNPAHATADGTDAGLPFADVHQPVSRWGAGTARPARQDARRGLWPYTADALFTARHSGTGPQRRTGRRSLRWTERLS